MLQTAETQRQIFASMQSLQDKIEGLTLSPAANPGAAVLKDDAARSSAEQVGSGGTSEGCLTRAHVQEVKEIMSNFINNEAPALTLKSSSEHEAAPAESEDLGLNFTG